MKRCGTNAKRMMDARGITLYLNLCYDIVKVRKLRKGCMTFKSSHVHSHQGSLPCIISDTDIFLYFIFSATIKIHGHYAFVPLGGMVRRSGCFLHHPTLKRSDAPGYPNNDGEDHCRNDVLSRSAIHSVNIIVPTLTLLLATVYRGLEGSSPG